MKETSSASACRRGCGINLAQWCIIFLGETGQKKCLREKAAGSHSCMVFTHMHLHICMCGCKCLCVHVHIYNMYIKSRISLYSG